MSQALTTYESHTVTERTAGAPTSSLCLPGRGLTLTELLQVLDVLRRQLARSTRGHEGAFAGFDVLDVSAWQDGDREGSVRFTARVVSDGDTSQTVEYSAGPCAHVNGRCHPVMGDEYLRARGTTVALARPQARPAPLPRPFLIASPHR